MIMKKIIKQLLRENLYNLKEYNEDDDYDDDDYNDDDENQEYFNAKLSDDVKRTSKAYHGRNVIWYGTPSRMVYLTKDEVEGMWGNIYDNDKLESLKNLILNYPDKVELECSYGHGSVVTIIDIKEEQEAVQKNRFEIDYDGSTEPSSTGDDMLDEFLGKDLDDMDWYDLDWSNDDIDNQEAIAKFLERNKISLAQGYKSFDELKKEFNALNPTPIQIETFKSMLEINNMLSKAEAYGDGDFNRFKVQLRDGHHRVFAAFAAGEKYVCVDLVPDDINKFKGYYNLV